MVRDPFYRSQAEDYTTRETVDRFVENRWWSHIREPVNQLVSGGYGAGKSMLMKRMSLQAMAMSPAFLPGVPFVGVYVNLNQELRMLDAVWEMQQGDYVKRAYQHKEESVLLVAEKYLVLSVVAAFLSCLQETLQEDRDNPILPQRATGPVLRGIASILRIEHNATPTVASLWENVESSRFDIENAMTNLEMLEPDTVGQGGTWKATTVMEQLARLVERATKAAGVPPARLYLLLDQFDSLATPVKKLVARLVKRGHRYKAKLTARPFSLEPSGPGLPVLGACRSTT